MYFGKYSYVLVPPTLYIDAVYAVCIYVLYVCMYVCINVCMYVSK
jgi:hypothetical protein